MAENSKKLFNQDFVFNSLIELWEITSDWIEHYNNYRPQESLGNLSPIQVFIEGENSPAQDSITEFSPFQQIFPTTTTPK